MLGASFGDGFGIAFVLEDQFTATAKKIRSEYKQLAGFTEEAAKGIAVGGMQAAAGLALLAPAIASIKPAAELEQTMVSFEVMLGSADKAKAMVADLQQMAVKTPFETTDLTQGAQMLMNYGAAARDVLPYLNMLGDASAGNRERFQRMTYAFSQIMAMGRLQGQDLRQLVDAGFNPLQVISEKTGKSMATLKDEMSDGLISFDMVAEAFKDATSEGGRFYQMMDKQSATFEGLKSTLKDNFVLVLQDFGTILLPYLKAGVMVLIDFTNMLRAAAQTPFGKGIFLAVTALGAFLTVSGSLRIAAAVLVPVLRMLGTTAAMSLIPMLPYIAAGVAIAGAFYFLSEAVNEFNKVLNADNFTQSSGLLKFMQQLGGVLTSVAVIWDSWNGETFNLAGMEAELEHLGILDLMINLGTWIVRVKEFFLEAWGSIRDVFKRFGEVALPIFGKLGEAFGRVWEALVKVFPQLGKATDGLNGWQVAGQGVGKVLEIIIAPLRFTIELFGKMLEAVLAVDTWLKQTFGVGLFEGFLIVIKAVADGFGRAFSRIGGYFNFVKNNVLDVVNFISMLIEKIKEAINYMGNSSFGQMIAGVAGGISDFLGLGGENLEPQQAKATRATSMGDLVAKNKAATANNNVFRPNINVPAAQPQIFNILQLDGEDLAFNTRTHLKDQDDRR